jgi:putative ABC transport system permease protein
MSIPLSPAWRMAWRNLRRNKRRNVATGSAIALGFAALLALIGYMNRVENYLRIYTIFGTRTGHVQVFHKGGLDNATIKPLDYTISPADQKEVETALATVADSGLIEFYGAQLQGSGLIGNGCKTVPFLATGMEPQLDERLRDHEQMRRWTPTLREYARGKPLAEYPEDLGPIALSEGLARLLGKPRVYDEIPADRKTVLVTDCKAADAKELIAADANVQLVAGGWSGMLSAQDGEVVAHYNTGVNETNSTAIFTSLKFLQKLYDTDAVTLFAIWLKDPKLTDAIVGELQARLDPKRFEVYSWRDERVSPFYGGTIEFLYTMIGFITFVLATVVVFSISNSATMTILERSQEIGMLRALGFSRSYVRGLFVREMLALALLAMLAGTVIGFVGIAVINDSKIHFNPPGIAGGLLLRLEPSLFPSLGAGLLIFSLALVAAWIAVRSVARRNIATLVLGVRA